ncbi:MAG: glycosyltransferase family 2 protein [Thermoanaerobaculia bacterium]|jgi:glycosyltransferase involved in cell wall biosynthesis|nr:glycosyltransferase family 2 protein [Thermoanaerobaculia bacterium]
MILGKRICVVMPAYNAAATLERTFRELDRAVVDRVLLVDDASADETVAIAQRLGIETHLHPENRGYGGNQKSCYAAALAGQEEIVVMLHPDYQYTPRLVPAMAAMIAYDEYDIVLGSRILGNGALAGGMPLYKYAANRALTLIENLLLGQKLSEYHTGLRAFRREALARLPLERNSDDFVFDNEILAQAFAAGLRVGELSCPTKYFREASSIHFGPSVRYGFGVLRVAAAGFLARAGLFRARFLRLPPGAA